MTSRFSVWRKAEESFRWSRMYSEQVKRRTGRKACTMRKEKVRKVMGGGQKIEEKAEG